MTEFDERTTANLNVVLNGVCRKLPDNGGDHETRRFIALRLVRAAQRGKKTLGALEAVARRALHGLRRAKAA